MTTITPTIAQLRMLSSIRGQIWAIRPEYVPEFALAALELPEKKEQFTLSDFFPMRASSEIDSDGIGHVEIKGALTSNSPKIYETVGLVTTYATIQKESEALIESGALGIVYHVNSPGGTVSGNVEAAKFIEAINVPTIAHCVGMACSAAYKLSAGCDLIAASASAEVGNIGTILSWADCTEFWKERGVEFKAMTNEGADLKSTFHLEPNQTQLEFLQEWINASGKEFREHVEQNRPWISQDVWRAGWYSGEKAEELGLVDFIGSEADAKQALISIIRQQSKSI